MFNRSREIISHHFHNVLKAIIELEGKFLQQPNGSQVLAKILNSSRFFPFFKVKDILSIISYTIICILYLIK